MRKVWSIVIGAVLLGVALWFAFTEHTLATFTEGTSSWNRGSAVASRGASRMATSRRLVAGEGQQGEGSPEQATDEEALGLAGDAGACSINGHVVDVNGLPLSGIQVTVVQSSLDIDMFIANKVTTDEDGAYVMDCLVPGSYAISAEGPGFVEVRRPLRIISATKSQTLDFVLPFAEIVSGTVVDEAGQPVSEVQLRLEVSGEGAERLPRAPSVMSRDDGTFRLDAPKAGSHTIELLHPDHPLTRLTVTAPSTEVRLVIRSGVNVEVEVVDEAGRPVQGATVRLQGVAGTVAEDSGKPDTTDEAGRVALKGFEPGTYRVLAVARAEGHLRTVTRELELRNVGSLRVRLQLEPGLDLSGVVVDGAGRPVEGAEVSAVPMSPPEASGEAEDPSLVLAQELRDLGQTSPCLSGPEGRFSLRQVRPGTYLVMASKQGYTFAPQGENRRTVRDQTGLLVSAGASDVRLVLDFGGLLRGRVLHEDGSPVTEFQLNGSIQEDPGGLFALPVERTEDRVLAFAASGLAGTERHVHAKRGETVDLGDIVLRQGREVLVRVLDAVTSRPVEAATVDLETPGQEGFQKSRSLLYNPVRFIGHSSRNFTAGVVRGVLTQKDGTVRLSGVAEQPLRLQVNHADYLPESLTLGSGQREVVVRLRSGARVAGRVMVGGEPAGQGLVVLLSPSGELVARSAVSGGEYELGPIRAGGYFLMAKDLSLEERAPIFFPVSVQVPESGVVTANLLGQEGGTTAEVETSEKAESLALVPGSVAMPGTNLRLRQAILLGHDNRVPGGGVRFQVQGLSPGHYTLFAVREWDVPEPEAYRQEVDVPAGNTVSFKVRPNWLRLAHEPMPEEP